MINNVFKSIHNKYLKFFNFLFHLRYLFLILSIFFVCILSIPKFFDYTKRDQMIKESFIKNLNLKLINFEKINYNIFPIPNIEIKNAELESIKSKTKFQTENVVIYQKIFGAYDLQNFEGKKFLFSKNKTNLNFKKFIPFVQHFYQSKNKISFKDLDVAIFNDQKLILRLNELDFANFGHKKNSFYGKIFQKKFYSELNKKNSMIYLKLPELGINTEVKLQGDIGKNSISGATKIKIINNKIKFNFKLDENFLKINDFFYRSKKLFITGENFTKYNPFTEINNIFVIKEIDIDILKKINLLKLIELKNLIKIIDSKNNILFISKKYNRKPINRLNLKLDLSYGRLNYSKEILLSGGEIDCKGNTNLTMKYPKLSFNCKIFLSNEKNFYKNFSLKYENKLKNTNFFVNGKIDILRNKIKFLTIKNGSGVNFPKDELIYFKNITEKFLLKKNFLDIFNTKNIQEFILEVS